MGLAFFAPLFFAGALFIAGPYIIHHIRRPEREPLKFSSLLFIPNIPKEVIERRQLQHILLLLLRILFLLLLALAFTRPHWRARAAFDSEDRPARHLILVDTSYSMGAEGVFDRAKEAALTTLDDVGEGEEVAVAAFGRALRIVAPFGDAEDPAAGTVAAARLAIAALKPTFEETAYLASMQAAQQLLMGEASEESENPYRMVLHMVSDFYRSGMPKKHTGWKLSPTVTLNLHDVAGETSRNLALADVAIRPSESGELRVLGKVKNWAKDDADEIRVRLNVDGVDLDENVLAVKGGNASQVAFQIEPRDGRPIEGYLALGDDGLDADNRRYFTWNPPRKKRVLIVADERPDERWPAGWFFQRALPNYGDLPWEVASAPQSDLTERLTNPGTRPAVIIVADADGMTAEVGRALVEFTVGGGQLLFVMNPSLLDAPGAATVLEAMKLEQSGLRFRERRESRFDLLSWIDLDHDIFVPFRGARLNDFSSLRFFNHFNLRAKAVDDPAKVIARFDDQSAAVLETAMGEGRAILWTFPVLLSWTNLPKNARFLPLLYETLSYLGELRVGAAAWTVGERIGLDALVMDDDGQTLVVVPGTEVELELDGTDAATAPELWLRAPGFFRTRPPGETAWRQVDPVNVTSTESDPTPVSLAEFELKMAASLQTEEVSAQLAGVGTELPGGIVVNQEYGRWLLLAVFLVIMIESWYMSVLRR